MKMIDIGDKYRRMVSLASPPVGRDKPALANYKDSFFFLSGGSGCDYDTGFDELASVDVYEVQTNQWKQAL